MKINVWIALLVLSTGISSCGLYSFSGTSIPVDVETFSVQFFDNKASIVSPLLSQTFTEKLKTKFISETNLSIQEKDGDFDFSGYISGYTVSPVSANSTEDAQLNRLKITVQAVLECEKDPKLSFEQSFSNFQDFDASSNFSSIESELIDEITDMLIQQIFNKAAINW